MIERSTEYNVLPFLIEPDNAMWDAFRKMALEYDADEPGRFPTVHDGFLHYLVVAGKSAMGIDLPPDHVPWNTYWLVDHEGRILGTSRLRHRLSARLNIEGGHIGYDIRPSARRKGLGKRILTLTCEKAVERGLTRVMVTCDADNVASARIIASRGGEEFESSISMRTGKQVRRFWIDIFS